LEGILQGALLGVRTPRIHARMRLLAITLALFATLGAGQLLTARSAEAYNHSWGCSAYAYVQCYDVTGTQYNPWVWVYAYMSATSDTICAKGITANNNVRSPQACLANSRAVGACFSGGLPETWAYVYWGGAGTLRAISGWTDTQVCSTGP
jgi:hypothetical protein